MTFSRIAVIYNPSAGRPRERQTSIDRFTQLLTDAGKIVDICPTEGPSHGSQLAREAVERGCDLVVANGGDGTMNEVLQGVVGTDATLGFWPGGTANVLAAEIHFPSAVDEVVGRIMRGQVKRVTVGRANERYFLLMAGIGLDAAISATVDPRLKQRLGKAAFAMAALRYIFQWDMRPVRVQVPGEQEIIARFVVAGNARSYGGGFRITPRAELTDPDLDLCIFDAEQRIEYLRFALAAMAGWHRDMPGVTYRKVRRAIVRSAARDDAHVQLDGEVVGGLPLLLEAFPERLKLLV